MSDESLCAVCGRPEAHRSHDGGPFSDHRFGTREMIFGRHSAGPWIPLSERKPDDGAWVLLRINGDYTSGDPRRLTVHRRSSIGRRNTAHGFDTIESTDGVGLWVSNEQVTHWAEICPPEAEPANGLK